MGAPDCDVRFCDAYRQGKSGGMEIGRREGRVEGLQTSLSVVLKARGFEVSEHSGRYSSCTETEKLTMWLRRSAVAGTAEDVFREDDRSRPGERGFQTGFFRYPFLSGKTEAALTVLRERSGGVSAAQWELIASFGSRQLNAWLQNARTEVRIASADVRPVFRSATGCCRFGEREIQYELFRCAFRNGFEFGCRLLHGETEAEAVLGLLLMRGVELTESARKRIMDCADSDQLDTWAVRAVVSRTAEDVFERWPDEDPVDTD
ncbi:hypothetical protein [Nocardiopsis coralliicola]